MTNNTVQIKIQAIDAASAALNTARASAERLATGMVSANHRIRDGVDSISTQLQAIKAQFAAFFVVIPKAAEMGRALYGAAESYKTINARLQNATQGALDFNHAQAATVAIARATGASLDSVAGLYGKLRLNAGMAAADAEKLTGILARATQLDGGGQGAQAALFQLQQGLASGTLRGDELNSVLEQTPTLALQIAKGLGRPQDALRKLAEEGKLTAEAVKQALFAQTGEIDAMFSRLPVTAARAYENVKTAAIQEFGQLDATLGATGGMASTLQALADHFRAVVGAAVAAAGAITAAWLQSIATRRAAETAAHVATLAEIVQRRNAEVIAARVSRAAAGTGTAAAAAAQSDLASAAAGLVAARAAAAEAATPISTLSRLMGLLGLAFRALTGPIGLAITGLTGLTGYLIANRDNVIDLGGQHATVGETIRAAWGVTVRVVAAGFTWLGDRLGLGAVLWGDLFASVFNQILTATKNAINGVIGAFAGLGDIIGNTAGYIVTRFRTAFSSITAMASGALADIKAALKGDFGFTHFKAAVARGLNDSARNWDQYAASLRGSLDKALGTDYVGRAMGRVKTALGEQVARNRDAAAAKQAEDWFNEDPAGPTPSPMASLAGQAATAGRKPARADAADAADAAFWARVDAEQAQLMQGRQTRAMAYALEQEAILNSLREADEDFARQAYQFDAEGINEDRTRNGADVLAGYEKAQARLAAIRQRLDAEVTIGTKTQTAAQVELRQETGRLGDTLSASLIPRLQDLIATAPDETTREQWRALYAAIQGMQATGQQVGPWAGMKAGLNEYALAITDTFATVKDAVGRAFKSMEDALVSLVTTGKLDFKALADSIISDLVRIQIQQSITKPLAKAFGDVNWGGLFGGLFAAKGGLFAAKGGLVTGPGGPTDDRVPAWLSNGEYVLSAKAVQHVGVPALDAYNKGRVPRFAAGGLVGVMPAPAVAQPAAQPAAQPVVVHQTFQVDARGADAGAVARLETALGSLVKNFKPAAVAAVREAMMKNRVSPVV